MLALTLFRLFLGRWSLGLGILWWWLGGVLGFLFVFSDRLVHSLITNPGETLSIKVKDLFREKKLVEGLRLVLLERSQQEGLMMRSILFVVIWLMLAFWTSLGVVSALGRGFMLGMGIHFIFDLLWDFFSQERKISSWFWQIKRQVTEEEQRWTVLVVCFLGILVVLGL